MPPTYFACPMWDMCDHDLSRERQDVRGTKVHHPSNHWSLLLSLASQCGMHAEWRTDTHPIKVKAEGRSVGSKTPNIVHRSYSFCITECQGVSREYLTAHLVMIISVPGIGIFLTAPPPKVC
jgi:hypothetical protein